MTTSPSPGLVDSSHGLLESSTMFYGVLSGSSRTSLRFVIMMSCSGMFYVVRFWNVLSLEYIGSSEVRGLFLTSPLVFSLEQSSVSPTPITA